MNSERIPEEGSVFIKIDDKVHTIIKSTKSKKKAAKNAFESIKKLSFYDQLIHLFIESNHEEIEKLKSFYYNKGLSDGAIAQQNYIKEKRLDQLLFSNVSKIEKMKI